MVGLPQPAHILTSSPDGTYLTKALQQQNISVSGARTHNLKLALVSAVSAVHATAALMVALR
jgi:hypothetical protein